MWCLDYREQQPPDDHSATPCYIIVDELGNPLLRLSYRCLVEVCGKENTKSNPIQIEFGENSWNQIPSI